MILNKSQADAVYSAICALNNIGNVSGEFNLPNDVWIQSQACGAIRIVPQVHGAKIESFASQFEFATAYGLN